MARADCSSVCMEEDVDEWDVEKQSRTARLKSVLDKINKERYKSIQCLRSDLEAVDRQISAAGLPQLQQTAKREAGNCGDFAGCNLSRRFFYNRAGLDPKPDTSCSARSGVLPPSTPAEVRPASGTLSVSSLSTVGTDMVCKSRTRKQTRPRRRLDRVSEEEPTEQNVERLPTQLDGVFKGFRTLKVESERLCTGLRQAREFANRYSAELSTCEPSTGSSMTECHRDGARRIYMKLVNCLDSSSRLAYRMQRRITVLEKNSQQKLSQIYDDIHLRRKFRLPPWPVTARKPPPSLVVRARGGVQKSCAETPEGNTRYSPCRLPSRQRLECSLHSVDSLMSTRAVRPASATAAAEKWSGGLLLTCRTDERRERLSRSLLQESGPVAGAWQHDSTECQESSAPRDRKATCAMNAAENGLTCSVPLKQERATPGWGHEKTTPAIPLGNARCRNVSSPCLAAHPGLLQTVPRAPLNVKTTAGALRHPMQHPDDWGLASGASARGPFFLSSHVASCGDSFADSWCCTKPAYCRQHPEGRRSFSPLPTMCRQSGRVTSQGHPTFKCVMEPKSLRAWKLEGMPCPHHSQEAHPISAEAEQGTRGMAPLSTPVRVTRISPSAAFAPRTPVSWRGIDDRIVEQPLAAEQMSRPFTRLDTEANSIPVGQGQPLQLPANGHPFVSISCPLQPSPASDVPLPEPPVVRARSTPPNSVCRFAGSGTPRRRYS
ncbi:hypothetical protein BESB_053380 [Besnoitia besnoiti]|uniref:Uncharacterized protein n=1 Tax=Besnoitia besnoiti TaxID=94643 RepID=A0A2A9MJB2_BESBE|nr:hypothetical protein BESB_053380 [Besnoitia besnoiti]PFH35687.1 hypothetical protein BESB_053380 [Besnoitia besnoiti]